VKRWRGFLNLDSTFRLRGDRVLLTGIGLVCLSFWQALVSWLLRSAAAAGEHGGNEHCAEQTGPH